jgi:hypothetical protein
MFFWTCMRKSYGVLLVALFIVWAPLLIAQTSATGGLTGTVTDPTGATVPNATVTLTSTSTGQVRTKTTGPDGTYVFDLLLPGTYRVRFTAPGFSVVEVPSATVSVTETGVLNTTLQVGAQTQQVTVQGEVETIQTASSALGTIVNNKTVTDLPLNTRNYTNLLAMTAGANSDINNATTIGKGAVQIFVNGGGANQNTWLEDGVALNNWTSVSATKESAGPASFAMPNPDAIAEFKIQTATYDAGYGRNPGANVNVITKSGTNSFHGTGFEFFRNSVLNANDWFYNFQGLPKPALNSNVYGGVLGGPVKKDKLFFFVSYQENDQKNGLSAFSSSNVILPPVPTGNRGTCPVGWTSLSQCDAAGQAFVPALGAAICPPNNPGNQFDMSKIGGIQVACDGSNINPVAVNVLQLQLPGGGYLIPSSGSRAYQQHTFSIPAIFKNHQGLGNFDYVINSKETLSGRYIYDADPLVQPFAAINALVFMTDLPGDPVKSTKTGHAAVLRLTSVLSNNLVNEARVSFQRNVAFNQLVSGFFNAQVGITDLTPGVDNLANISIAGQFNIGTYPTYIANFPENQFEWADQVSWTRGKHTFRAGFEVSHFQLSQSYTGMSIGTPAFQSFPDFLIGRAACAAGTFGPGAGQCNPANPGNTNGTAATSSVGGVGAYANAFAPFRARLNLLNGFIQDDFKLSSRLTLNLGLRWEYDAFPTAAQGLWSNYWPSLLQSMPLPPSTPQTGSLVGYVVPSNYTGVIPAGVTQNTSKYLINNKPPWDDFAPRVGFAWQPTSSNRLVVRGGAGYFYDLPSEVFTTGGFGGSALNASNPVYGTPSGGSPSGTLQTPWVLPAGVVSVGPGFYGFSPRWLNTATGASSSLTVGGVAENLTTPVTYEWTLNTQWEFVRNWVLEVGYVGSKGIHQGTLGSITQTGSSGGTQSMPFNLAQLVGVGSPCASCGLTGVTTNTAQNATLRAPLLGISTQDVRSQTDSNYKYNGLQVTLRKQLSHGLQLQAAYAWSRAFAQAPQGINTYPYLVYTYGLSTYYHPSRIVISYVWKVPLGRQKGFVGKVLDDWSVSGVTTIQDGLPLTIKDVRGGTVFGAPNSVSTAQYCPGMTLANVPTSGSLQQRVTSGLLGGAGYLNGTAFCAPPQITGAGNSGTLFGNVGFGTLLGPGQSNWDMSISKMFPIREAQNLEFRTEFFNTFNHPQFGLPDTTASNATFGRIGTTLVNPRVIQLALKFSF